MQRSISGDWTRWLRRALAGVLATCCALYVVVTRHWPLIGDATTVHYLVLLMRNGMAPYRDIVDAQMPGTYLLDWVVVHLVGGGAAGLRIYDLTLVALAGAAMIWIAGPGERFAGFFAGALLALVHGRDGIPQAAQRDLIIAVLMLGSYAFAFHAVRRGRAWWMLLSGICAGMAGTIKPTALPVGLVLLAVVVMALRKQGRGWGTYAAWSVAGMALPVAAVAVFLARERALAAFWDAVHGMWPYYARLAPRPLGWLLLHSVSPLLPLVAVWGVVLVARAVVRSEPEERPGWERVALWLGLAMGLLSYLGQRKGYPYHRYPLLVFLLLLIALDLSDALGRRGVLRMCGAVGLAVGALILAPVSLYKITTYDWRSDELYAMLAGDLNRLGGPQLSHHVQCLDTFSGCINALDRMQLVESTGFLLDFFFWPPQPGPVTEEMREKFWTAIHENPPWVLVVMREDFPNGTETYEKLNRWPEFAEYLKENYRLDAERMPEHWVKRESRPDPPTGYRIYVWKTPGAAGP
jgi:hypothetical protein